jgi:hypothetical protein
MSMVSLTFFLSPSLPSVFQFLSTLFFIPFYFLAQLSWGQANLSFHLQFPAPRFSL